MYIYIYQKKKADIEVADEDEEEGLQTKALPKNPYEIACTLSTFHHPPGMALGILTRRQKI